MYAMTLVSKWGAHTLSFSMNRTKANRQPNTFIIQYESQEKANRQHLKSYER